MVKIRLLDGPDVPDEEEAFLTLKRHKDGFAVVLVYENGDQIAQPFVLFLKPHISGRLTLTLASFPNPDFVQKDGETNTIAMNPSH